MLKEVRGDAREVRGTTARCVYSHQPPNLTYRVLQLGSNAENFDYTYSAPRYRKNRSA